MNRRNFFKSVVMVAPLLYLPKLPDHFSWKKVSIALNHNLFNGWTVKGIYGFWEYQSGQWTQHCVPGHYFENGIFVPFEKKVVIA